ncbi:thioredoxin domain-containing protein [Rathayibacter sp. YIM 133350]|uniref:DsbA family protein n=1 Tax=Rathayibacter sp. YIM 133350 TaxID=3131992 RepID=UPI00307D18DE
MTHGNEPRPSKNQRREAAREKARQLREEQKKKERRNRVLLQSGIAVVVLAIVAIVVLVIVQSVKPAGPGPKNMASDGILIGEGLKAVQTPAIAAGSTPTPSVPDETGNVANIRMYVDYLCPYCNQFESTNSAQMEQWLNDGAATVEIHPINLLEGRSLGTKYSLRAANAAACVANYSPNDFWAFNTAMYANQPQENTAGPSDQEMIKVIKDAGVGSMSKIESCVKGKDFNAWVNAATDRAVNEPLPNSDVKEFKGTPTVIVNGKSYSGSLTDPKEFSSFVLQAAGETYSTSTPTPTPTPAG